MRELLYSLFKNAFLLLLILFLGISCTSTENNKKLFEKISPEKSGITFKNRLDYTRELNPYTYRNFYNGGGVGIGDFNNDGLQDIYFTGNQVSNKLYLNKGNFRFEDITQSAGVASAGVWSTGVSVVDINGDGWLDIYVCKSGQPGGKKRHNELFINNGDLTFTEQAAMYGIDIVGLSTDATFFDYDHDGDLDMYLLNNSFEPVTGIEMQPGLRNISDPEGGDKLFRNEMVSSGKADSSRAVFTDVTNQAGIFSSKIGFGLDVLAGDVNGDNWPDLYITNDFFERDYLYLNNGDGSFTEMLPKVMQSISLSSMGGDLGDINHDGLPEIYVTDMLPEPLERAKSKTAFDFWDEYSKRVQTGYHYQFVRNTLQLNKGYIRGRDSKPKKKVSFSEIGRFAGVESTDWSWTVLFADLNLDGSNDIFVTNGIYKDLTDQDYVSDNNTLRKVRSIIVDEQPVDVLFDEIPSVPVPNYAFAGSDSLSFTNKAEKWGLAEPGFSNGAAYADLDNDGDLDLVINNVNTIASVYENRINRAEPNQKSLTLLLKSSSPNTFGIGTKVKAWVNDTLHFREFMPNRGFQSSVDPRVHIGLGSAEKVDSLTVLWPEDQTSVLYDIEAGQILTVQQPTDKVLKNEQGTEGKTSQTIFKQVAKEVRLDYSHRENIFENFSRNPMLYEMYSNDGPASCKADINNDGLDDLYLGGAKDQAGAVYIQNKDRSFTKKFSEIFAADKESEDTDCAWFDANADGIIDLYVASGGSEFPASSSALADRLYLNINGTFKKAGNALPASKFEVTGVVKASDFDGDGDTDLFTGSRFKPFAYGIPASGHLLENDGTGNFSDVSARLAPGLQELGMLTDAAWTDFDNDGDADLVIVGEWMPVTVFENTIDDSGNRAFVNISEKLGFQDTNGLWKTVVAADIDGDGYEDIIAGNHGLNSQLRATKQRPLKLWVNDFDQNGSIEQILTVTDREQNIPLILRQDVLASMPRLSARVGNFKKYSAMSMVDLFSEEELGNSMVLSSYEMRSAVFWNENGKQFKMNPFPDEVQFAPVFAFTAWPSSESGEKYIIAGGNLSSVKPQFGSYRSSYGVVMKSGSDRGFSIVDHSRSGFFARGEIRAIYPVKSNRDTLLFVTRNNDKPLWFQ